MSDAAVFTKDDLLQLKPRFDSFVGIDSDGCVFETMEIKQKQCFHSEIIRNWGLERIENYVREAAEFVNLYSNRRGQNRFPCLVMVFDLLRERPEAAGAGVPLPRMDALRAFIASGKPLSNAALDAEVQRTGDRELAAVLKWSGDVNAAIARTVRNIPPFPWVREFFERMKSRSDAICVSQTPTEALAREWADGGIRGYVRVLAGQELGTKQEHLEMATRGRYRPERVLMIGDAPGDLRAARGVHGLFYPINPGREAASWERLCREAYDRFLAGTYAGAYEQRLVDEFNALLPDTPPWKRRTA